MSVFKKVKFKIVGLLALVIIVVIPVTSWLTPGVSVKSDNGKISLSVQIAVAAQLGGAFGDGSQVTQQAVQEVRRGGPPVRSVAYNFNAILDTDDILAILNCCGIPDIHVGKAKAKAKAKGQGAETADEVAARIKEEEVQPIYEIWTLLSSFSADDPVRNNVLLDNEKIVKLQGKDYLVTSLAYFDMHIYSLDISSTPESELRFTTRIRGLDSPYIDNWW